MSNRAPLFGTGFAAILALSSALAFGEGLPQPLRLSDATQFALRHRSEITAAKARADAYRERPAIVAGLEDPMLSPSIEHYPFEMMEGEDRRFDWNVTVEQRLPLSGMRGYRRDAARADARRMRALATSTTLDVVLNTHTTFYMLAERRQMQRVIDAQVPLAEQLIEVASSRYSAGTASQADVLRAEVELARLRTAQRSQAARTRAAEAMLNSSLGRDPAAEIPKLLDDVPLDEPPAAPALIDRARSARPELVAGEAETERAAAEVDVMRSMYKPMAMIRVGRGSTMSDGAGGMIMVGMSLPIWRDKLRAGVAEALAMQRMAQADLQAMQRMIDAEVLAAREEVSAARVEVLTLESEVVPRAQAAVDAALAGYVSGRGTLVSVIESAQTLWQIQAEQIMANAVLGEAWARFNRAMGTTDGQVP